jgi:hypothetical protein
VEGYRGGRLINPDKDFHYRLLSAAEHVVHVDRPLFAYRVHTSNQNSQERRSGALKRLVDEYCYTFDLDPQVLDRSGVAKEDVVKAFVEHDIALRGLASLSEDDRTGARRTLRFGQAVYPEECHRNWKVWALGALLHSGPVGTRVARSLRSRAEQAILGSSPYESRPAVLS